MGEYRWWKRGSLNPMTLLSDDDALIWLDFSRAAAKLGSRCQNCPNFLDLAISVTALEWIKLFDLHHSSRGRNQYGECALRD